MSTLPHGYWTTAFGWLTAQPLPILDRVDNGYSSFMVQELTGWEKHTGTLHAEEKKSTFISVLCANNAILLRRYSSAGIANVLSVHLSTVRITEITVLSACSRDM